MEPIITYYPNGNKHYERYLINGKYHRLDGPAFTSWFKNGNKCVEQYWVNGYRHRLDGPAITYWFKNGNKCYEGYYLNGKELLPEWFMELGYDITKDIIDQDIINMVLLKYGDY